MGMYDSLWRYAEIVEFFRLCVASIVSVTIFTVTTLLMFTERRVPISIYGLSAMFASLFTLYSRLTYRMYRNTKLAKNPKPRRRVLLIGAGDAASTLLHEVFKSRSQEMNIVCCVDAVSYTHLRAFAESVSRMKDIARDASIGWEYAESGSAERLDLGTGTVYLLSLIHI